MEKLVVTITANEVTGVVGISAADPAHESVVADVAQGLHLPEEVTWDALRDLALSFTILAAARGAFQRLGVSGIDFDIDCTLREPFQICTFEVSQ